MKPSLKFFPVFPFTGCHRLAHSHSYAKVRWHRDDVDERTPQHVALSLEPLGAGTQAAKSARNPQASPEHPVDGMALHRQASAVGKEVLHDLSCRLSEATILSTVAAAVTAMLSATCLGSDASHLWALEGEVGKLSMVRQRNAEHSGHDLNCEERSGSAPSLVFYADDQ